MYLFSRHRNREHYERPPLLDCFAPLAMTRVARSTAPVPIRHCKEAAFADDEAIQWKGRLDWIASPYGFAMTRGHPLPSTRPRPSLRAKRSNLVERPPRLDCFTLLTSQ
ncbi:MAG: hypothetical protein LBT00_03145 [Spirochaetaceae bacterium]|nr:hypothetical protein [Spirochaetaceae bacterium]